MKMSARGSENGGCRRCLPETGSAPDGERLAVALDVACLRGMVQDQGEGQDPTEIEESEQCDLVPPLGELPIDEVGYEFLDRSKPGRDLLYLWWIGALGPPRDCATPLTKAYWNPIPVERLGRLAQPDGQLNMAVLYVRVGLDVHIRASGRGRLGRLAEIVPPRRRAIGGMVVVFRSFRPHEDMFRRRAMCVTTVVRLT